MTQKDNAVAKRGQEQPVVQPPSSHAPAIVQQHPLLPRFQLARMFPRDVAVFTERLRMEATAEPVGLWYRKPQGGGFVIGPSVRMSEIGARLFGNLYLSEPKIDERDGRVTVTVEALDLETNVSVPGVGSNSLVGKDGKRMSADVISNLIAGATAKAKRNAIFGIIGKATFDDLVGPCMAAAEKRTAENLEAERKAGKAGDLWRKAVAAWAKAKITEAELLRAAGAARPDDVTPEAHNNLIAAWNAVTTEGVAPRVALGLDREEPTSTTTTADDDLTR